MKISEAGLEWSESNQSTRRAKHIDLQYHFISDFIDRKINYSLYISSEENIADAITKSLSYNNLKRFEKSLM